MCSRRSASRVLLAVHRYHNLVVIEEGDNVEGTSRDTAALTFGGSNDGPAAP